MIKDLPVHRPFDAFQDFMLGCKLHWTRTLYPALRETYDEAVRNNGGQVPANETEVQALIGDDPQYRYFAWLERHVQRMKYSGRHGLVRHFSAGRDELASELEAGAQSGLLDLDPDFRRPAYYVAVDIHQHEGGVWSDETAGYAYERGARTTTPLLRQDADLHHRFTREVLARAGTPGRLADLGCGFGKSTRPFYANDHEMEIVALDLSAPCLKLAARTASLAQARNVRFVQAEAADTKQESESFDVVTSTMLLHEMPPPYIERTLQETHRLLAPGGLSIHLDFLSRGDAFAKFIHYGHSARNNEPFMPPLNEMDLEAAHRRAGFESFEVVPFEEMPGTLSPDFKAWRFPWVMIIARKAA